MLTIEDIMVPPPGEGQVVEPMAWFDSPGPFEIEIGCGKGRFLLHRARSRPDVRLLGIEWANKFYRYAADRMRRWGVANVRLMRTDAATLVRFHLPPASVDAFHVYHPDPWPKKRHHKRRLIQGPFVAAALRATRPGGRWLIQSDHDEYFDSIRTLLDVEPSLREVSFDDPAFGPGEAGGAGGAGGDWAGTNYEVKYATEGRAIHRVAYLRRD